MSDSVEWFGTNLITFGVPLTCAFVASHTILSYKGFLKNGKSLSEYNWVNTSGIVFATLAGAYLITPSVLDRTGYQTRFRWS